MKQKIKLISAILIACIAIAEHTDAQTVTTPGGTSGYIPKFTAAAVIGNSLIFDNGTNVSIGLAGAGSYKLDVNGHTNITSSSAYKIGGNNILWHNGNTANIFVGVGAGASNTGLYNTFIGNNAGNANVAGVRNTAVGYEAFKLNASSSANDFTAIGYQALKNYNGGAGEGEGITAVGSGALYTQTNGGFQNTAIGYNALYYCNTTTAGTAEENTAVGHYALYFNTTGRANSALGDDALIFNTTGNSNTAMGAEAGRYNVTGNDNSSYGFHAGFGVANNSNSANSFFGSYAGVGITTGSNNAFMGYKAGYSNTTGYRNSFVGNFSGYSNTSGASNSFVGDSAGYSNTTGTVNSFIGNGAGYSNITGSANSFIGNGAGFSNTASYNTFVGNSAGFSNTTATGNAFMGSGAGYLNTTGASNSFIGHAAGYLNTTGASNSFMGHYAGFYNTGSYNSFVGSSAGYNNTTGSYNSFVGHKAGYSNTAGAYNSYMGQYAGYSGISGDYNSAFGEKALYLNTASDGNAAFGYHALYSTTGDHNTAIGYYAGHTNTTGNYNTFVGYAAVASAATYTNCAAIGNGAIATASNKIYFGNASVTHIQGAVAFTVSDGRFKTNVKENVKGLAFIKKLRPVTYNMDSKKLDDFLIQNMADSIKIMHKQGMDFGPSMAIVHAGFIAQEVEKAAQDADFISSIVSTPSNSTDPYALSYSEIVVPLVKAVQELSAITDSLTIVKTKQDSIINSQNAKMDDLQNQLTQLASTINACCNVINTKGLKSLSDGFSQTNVNLNNSQVIILDQNVPNPFAEQTTINYFLPDNTLKAQMLFYNAQGLLIQSVDLTQKGKGALNVFANDLTNGIYTYTLVVDGKIIETKKMLKQ